MTVLDGLREGGRMVGIVSHVSGNASGKRIPARIHVRKWTPREQRLRDRAG